MKKQHKILSLFLSCVFFFSCSDKFLELTPIDSASVANFYKTESDFEAAIIGSYSNWRLATDRPPMETEYRSDNLYFTAYYGYELSSNDLTPNIGLDWWNLFQQLVYPSNIILDKIEKAEGINPLSKDRIKGEALFFRGYAYYWMNLVFGGVPIVTSQISAEEALNIPRSTEDATWVQAASDFETAAGLLPPTPSTFGRIDKYDAMGFLAKVYLQQKKWDKALPILKNIYDNSGHALETVWTNMWDIKAEKTTKEFMLTSIGSDLFPNNDFAQQYLRIDGDGSTQGVFKYKKGLLSSFQPNDIRRDATLGVTPLGFDQNNKYDYGKVGNNWTLDIVVLRFTDIVLMYAEALTMAAGTVQQQSLDLINKTRNRAGLLNLTMGDVPNLDAFVEAILAERRAEFVFEGTRYADLKRHNKLLSKLSAIGYNFNESYLLLPIPQTEMDKMPNVLKQNPGY